MPERIGRLVGQPAMASRQRSAPGGALVVAAVIVAAGVVFAQSQPARRQFDAVSIKPNELGGGHVHSQGSAGRLNASMTTKSLIEMAFGLKRFQVTGGPGWMDEINYDFVASTGDATELTDKVLEPYLQTLLANRFHLVYHRETKELPVYSLVTAKGGPKLTPHTGDEGSGSDSNGKGGRVDMSGRNLTMARFASFLSQQMDRPVIDNTGIAGAFDVKMQWSNDQTPGTPGPSIFTALQEQLGLRLTATKGPVEILVVDSVDKPSEN